ncbi:hypothetical protein LB507_009249 [Fusarium sp. FIESC RH6]|nr:hypothetical protein LB507_009249 [Fusarium sp. FIESC RH6]
MIHRFKSLVAGNRAKQKKETKEGYPEPGPDLPFFLNTEKQLLPISSTSTETQGAPIFSKLPPEIRREIPIKAFGARRIHMDLFYGHPYISIPGDNGLPHG